MTVRYKVPNDVRKLHNNGVGGQYSYVNIMSDGLRLCDIQQFDKDKNCYELKVFMPNGNIVCGWLPSGILPEIHNYVEMFDGRFNS